jgi:hypothetical protein
MRQFALFRYLFERFRAGLSNGKLLILNEPTVGTLRKPDRLLISRPYVGLAGEQLLQLSTHAQRERRPDAAQKSASIKRPIECGVDCFCEVLEV